MDLEYSHREQVAVMPRNFPLVFREKGRMDSHYAMVGVACLAEGYPLYYDGVNEKGLAMAGLNFPGNACYHELRPDRDNVAPFELIPWVLSQCADVAEAVKLLEKVSLWRESFSAELPLTHLHWMLADGGRSVVAEPMADGLRIYKNPVDVMTNNPPFPRQLREALPFARLRSREPEPNPSDPEGSSRGLGALGLPGDWSSASRFARAVFVRTNACGEGVGAFFRMLGAVEVPEGCITLRDGRQVKTVYTSAYDLERGICCYTTAENHRIRCVDMHREQLDGSVLARYPMRWEEEIYLEN